MLAQLATLKARLALDPSDPTQDALLLRALTAVSARFDLETGRTLARTLDFRQEFDARDTCIIAACYPIESVSRFEYKSTEAGGWTEQTPVDYLIRGNCVISLSAPFNLQLETRNLPTLLARVRYTGGYVCPGDPTPQPITPDRPPLRLPAELEQAALEQAAFWFQTRDKLGVLRQWPKGGSYEQYADIDLLPSVRAVLTRYQRMAI